MTPTISWIETKFEQFNQQYFDGKLKKCLFKISSSRSSYGNLSWRYIPGTVKRIRYCGRLVKDGKYKEGSAVLKLSKFYDVTEQQLEATLIHEMIHLEMVLSGRCYEGHGLKFRQRAREISKEGKYQINVTDNYQAAVNETVAAAKRKKYQVFILFDFVKLKRLYILGDPNRKNENSEAVDKFMKFYNNRMKLEGSCILDHDMFIGRRFSIKYTYRRGTSGYYFENNQQYEQVINSAESYEKYDVTYRKTA